MMQKKTKINLAQESEKYGRACFFLGCYPPISGQEYQKIIWRSLKMTTPILYHPGNFENFRTYVFEVMESIGHVNFVTRASYDVINTTPPHFL